MKTYKILVIDDAFFIRNLIKKAIGRKPSKNDISFEIVGEAANGNEGIRMCEELKPDIITVDFNIPELNGLEFAKYLKEINPKIPILMISSNDDPAFPAQVESIGCHFLPKPFQESFLWIRLDGLVEEIENFDENSLPETISDETIDLMKEISMEVEAEFEENPIELEDSIQIPKSQATIKKESEQMAEVVTESITEETSKKKKKKKKKNKSSNFFGLELEDNFVIKPTQPENTEQIEEINIQSVNEDATDSIQKVNFEIQKNEESITETSVQVKTQPAVKPITVKPVPKIDLNIQKDKDIITEQSAQVKVQPTVKPIAVKPIPKIDLNIQKDKDIITEQSAQVKVQPTVKPIAVKPIPKIDLNIEKDEDIIAEQPIQAKVQPIVKPVESQIQEEPEEDFLIFDDENTNNINNEDLTADVDGEIIIIDEDDEPIIIDDNDDEIIIVDKDEEIVIDDDNDNLNQDLDEDDGIIIETEDTETESDTDFDNLDLDNIDDFFISTDETLIEEKIPQKRIGLNIKKEVPVVQEELSERELIIKTLKENANYSYQNEMSYVLHIMERIASQKKEEQLPVFDDEPVVQEQKPLNRLINRSKVTKSEEIIREKEEEDAEFDQLFAEFNPNIDLSNVQENNTTLYKEESKDKLLNDAPSITQNIVIEPPKSERIRKMYNKDDVDEDQFIVPISDEPKKISIFTRIFNFFSRKKK